MPIAPKKIARKLYTVNGVVNVQANVSKNFAVITPQAGKMLSPRALWNAVELAKFKPVEVAGSLRRLYHQAGPLRRGRDVGLSTGCPFPWVPG